MCLITSLYAYLKVRILAVLNLIGENYWGNISLSMTLKKVPSKTLFLDFRGVSIGNLTINGTAVNEQSSFRDHKVYLPTQHLKTDGSENKVLEIFNKMVLTKFIFRSK